METAYDGRQVVGMDLHRRRSVLVRMTEDGRRLGIAAGWIRERSGGPIRMLIAGQSLAGATVTGTWS